MKGIFSAILASFFLYSMQVKASGLEVGVWEGVSLLNHQYVLLKVSKEGEHRLYYGHLASQTLKGEWFYFTDNEVECSEFTCKVQLLERNKKNINHSINLVVSNDRILVTDLVKDKQGVPIFPSQYELRKQGKTPIASYFYNNKEVIESESDKTITGVWMGADEDAYSQSIYRLKISEKEDSFLEKFNFGSSGKHPIKTAINYQDLVLQEDRAFIEIEKSDGICQRTELEIFLVNKSSLDVYQTCTIKGSTSGEVKTATFIRMIKARR